MANVFRGPLYVNRRERPPHLFVPTVTIVGSLLLTTLAVVAEAPVGTMLTRSAPYRLLYLPLDSTRGMPLTLRTAVVFRAAWARNSNVILGAGNPV
jgi:hypothetical protein